MQRDAHLSAGAEHPVRPSNHLCWQVSRLADSGLSPSGCLPSQPFGQWFGHPFRSRSRGRLRLRADGPCHIPSSPVKNRNQHSLIWATTPPLVKQTGSGMTGMEHKFNLKTGEMLPRIMLGLAFAASNRRCSSHGCLTRIAWLSKGCPTCRHAREAGMPRVSAAVSMTSASQRISAPCHEPAKAARASGRSQIRLIAAVPASMIADSSAPEYWPSSISTRPSTMTWATLARLASAMRPRRGS